MLRSARGLLGYRVDAADGHLGRISDLCFDDSAWVIRHIVARMGPWPVRRRVALPVDSVEISQRDGAPMMIRVRMTREQALGLRELPQCVAGHRRPKIELSRFRHWLPRWPARPGAQAAEAAAVPRPGEKLVLEDQNVALHLRSFTEVLGYRVWAGDGRLGRVDDLVADTERWSVAHMVVRPRWWRRGGPVHLPPDHVERLDGDAGSVEVRLEG